MLSFDIKEFQERFEDLVEMVAASETFELHQDGKPVALISAFDPAKD